MSCGPVLPVGPFFRWARHLLGLYWVARQVSTVVARVIGVSDRQ